jgi:hypothetical protein
VGNGIGKYLGHLIEFHARNTIHSSYIRLKVQIDVIAPLKHEWQIRVNDGSYATICFKCEKLGTFCYLCGCLGHTDKMCSRRFDMEEDDGSRGWGEWLRPVIRCMGSASTNIWLQDPIPSRVQQDQQVPAAGFNGLHMGTLNSTSSGKTYLEGRISVVHNEINDIKSRLTAV